MRTRKTILPWLIWAGAIAIVLVYLLKASPAHAAVPLADCDFVAAFARRMAFFRDIGADPKKVAQSIRAEVPSGAGGASTEQLVRLAQRVMKSALSRDEAMVQEFNKCQRSLGDLGSES